MRAAAALLLAALAWIGAACAPQAPAEPALWVIRDADSEIYLFGSVHVLPPGLAWRSARINSAFASAEELVVETDPDPQTTAELVARFGMQPEGRTLSAQLSAERGAQLQRVATSLRLDPNALEQTRPWLASLQISFAYALSRGHRSEAGVENVLMPEARAAGKRVTHLETPEQQIRTLADLSEADQIRFFEATLDQIEHDDGALERLDAAWARGDVATLARIESEDLHAAGDAPYAALITNRNAAWTEEIARRLDGSGRIFFAVGAAHLVGDGGVVALLRARGIEVEGP